MEKYKKILLSGLKLVDGSDENLRLKLYKSAHKALERHAEARENSENFLLKNRKLLNAAIENIEKDYQVDISSGTSQNIDDSLLEGTRLEPEMGIATNTASVETELVNPTIDQNLDAPTMVHDDRAFVESAEEKPRRKLLLPVLLGLGVIFGLGYWIFNNLVGLDNEVQQSAEIGEANTPAEETNSPVMEVKSLIDISAGRSFTSNGNAQFEDIGDMMVLRDNLEDKVAFHQWIVAGIPANSSNEIVLGIKPRDNFNAFFQVQIVYSGAEVTTKNYTYVMDLSNGKVFPKGALATPDFRMPNLGGSWEFKVETKSPEKVTNMQMLIKPVVGEETQGLVMINNITIK